MALTEEEKRAVVATVETEVVKKLAATGSPVVVAVERTAPPPAEPKKLDPYRPALHFLTGLLAFCLTLIVALFAALDADKGPAVNALVSWVLMGIAATAAVGTIAIGLLQWAKSRSPDTFNDLGKFGAGVAIVAVLCGVGTVLLCVRGALIVAEQNCIEKPVEGIGETVLTQLLVKNQGARARSYAEARAHDCFAAGDLASSAAWSKIAAALPQ